MEKAKSFKWTNVLYLLLLLPLMFVFAACGEDPSVKQLNTEASCNTSGDYATEATKADYTTAVGEQTAIDADGYRITAVIKMQTGSGDEAVSQEIMKVNMIMKEVRTDTAVTYQMAMKMKMKNIFKGLLDEDTPDEIIAYAYYKDGKIYSEDQDGNKYYDVVSIDDMFDSETMSLMAFTNLEEILGAVNAVGDVTVTKEGNNFKVVANGAANIDGQSISAGATAYINFNSEGKIVAAQLSYDMAYLTSTMNCQFTLSGFNGDIAFPDLTKYTQAPEEPDNLE